MHIVGFLTTGHAHHFFARPKQNPLDQISAYQQLNKSNPNAFKNSIARMLENPINDPGNRRLFVNLLPFVMGNSLAAGLHVYDGHRRESALQKNYLRLGETKCNSVTQWWQNVAESDLRL